MHRKITVIVQLSGKAHERTLSDGSTVEDLLAQFNLHPDAYIVTKGSKPVPITRRLEDGDNLKLIKVASGG
ncbi:MAG: MoaD/ThiS family protein [Methanomassiliicoccales archaeon]|nr:MoaD/ThiS family protein [Methanomassiliicoccales archaeon]